MTIVRLVIDILLDKQSIKRLPKLFSVMEMIAICAISVTFMIYNFILTPILIAKGEWHMILSFPSLCLHIIIPIVSLINYLILENHALISKKSILWSGTFSLYYLAFVLVCNTLNVVFNNSEGNDKYFPYFFMNYYDHGWFRIGHSFEEIGLFYWMIIIVGGSCLLGLIFYMTIYPRMERVKEARIDHLLITMDEGERY